MSIFQNQTTQPTAEQVAQFIKSQASSTVEQMLSSWLQAYNFVWSDGIFTAEEKIAALGTEAGELFQANEDFVAFMIAQLTGKRDDLVEVINNAISSRPAYTINADGTVTLD